MAHLLEKRFDEVTTDDSQLKLLNSQWQFDKVLIPKALQQVSNLFPHFSRHDHSHSEQILINIERLLGKERISLLSATDIWLLLEVAYWHDIGMVVTASAQKSAFEQDDFKVFLKKISIDVRSGQNELAAMLLSNDFEKALKFKFDPFKLIEDFKLLMAEWFRRKHPERAELFVNDPWTQLGLSSPRTELIPKRLFRLLGRICSLHGESFDKVMQELPFKEVGISNDDCHPRFIACLLRLGDLLDMDDNRFCPVMQRVAGENRPALSKAHEDKHNSILHFRLDSNRIEVHAVCSSVDGYVEQWRWLDYLRSEIKNQMTRWEDIAPSATLGLLPTIGDVRVEIYGKQLIAQEGKRPEFGINTEKIMNLLKGENLYKKEDAIRELLQNSIDATLIRIWLDGKMNVDDLPKSFSELKKKFYDKYPIELALDATPIQGDEDNVKWQVTILDRGIGLSPSDLPYIMNVANSSLNIKKQIMIDEMPEWLKPSGNFGIGLQSVFMWTDVVKLKSKNIFDGVTLCITLHSPTGPQNGLITVEKIDSTYQEPVGTELKFEFILPKIETKYSISSGDLLSRSVLESFDPLLDNVLPMSAYKIGDSLYKFSTNSPVMTAGVISQDGKILKVIESEFSRNDNSLFVEKTNSSFSCYFNQRRENELYYRGQHVEDAKIPGYHFISYKLDLYSGKASEWLNFNRNSISQSAGDKISDIVEFNLPYWLLNNLNSLNDDEKVYASLISTVFVNFDFPSDIKNMWASINGKLSGLWYGYLCNVWSNGGFKSVAVGEIIKDKMIISPSGQTTISRVELNGVDVVLGGDYYGERITQQIVTDWCKADGNAIEYIKVPIVESHSNKRKEVLCVKLISNFNNKSKLKIKKSLLVSMVEKAIVNAYYVSRLQFPICLLPDELNGEKLRLKGGVRYRGVLSTIPIYPYFPYYHLVLPFEIRVEERSVISIGLSRYDEFIKWVIPNLREQISYDEVKEIYDGIIEYFNKMMNGSSVWKNLIKAGR